MKRLSNYFVIILAISLLFMIIDFSRKSVPKFKVNECAKDFIQEYTRKVLKVRKWVYIYCVVRDNKCKKKYSMRIADFDRIMKPIKCPGVV